MEGELRKFKNLFDEGLLTKEVYEAKQRQLLGLPEPTTVSTSGVCVCVCVCVCVLVVYLRCFWLLFGANSSCALYLLFCVGISLSLFGGWKMFPLFAGGKRVSLAGRCVFLRRAGGGVLEFPMCCLGNYRRSLVYGSWFFQVLLLPKS